MLPASFDDPVVACRPALPGDTRDVLEFTKFTWEGRDYVQHVWSEWLADPHGILAVAEYAGRAVGLAKVSRPAPGQWWLEGFRVDPRYQNRGIGSHLHAYIDAWWERNGDGVARLMTSSQRVKVHHLCEKLGYARIAQVAGFGAPVLAGDATAFQPLQPGEITRALRSLGADLAPVIGLVDRGWQFVAPERPVLEACARDGSAWWWREGEGLLLTWVDEGEDPSEERMLAIGLPAVQPDALPVFLQDFRSLASQQGFARVFWIAPLQTGLGNLLEAAGFTREWEHAAYLFEKRHPAGPA